jgi:hypothetical protein
MRMRSVDSQRAKVRSAVQSRGLVSVMSDTKWRELVSAVSELPFAPAFQLKEVLGDAPVPASFEEDVWYVGDWDEGLLPYYSVEWIRVRPRVVKHRGKYAPPEIQDIEREFLSMLCAIGVPHRRHGDCIEIPGYAESTAGLR